MAKEEHCPTVLLTDTPAESDAFGGHERIARSICEVVQSEHGGRAIGLEGGWGAGKSTIVKLTSDFLTQTKGRAFRVAVFDMWAHQDDPLRRTFLENLIGRIAEFGWVNRKEWERRLDELARRRHEEKTKEVPRLTRTGLLFVFTLLCIPVGAALISAGATLLASKDASGGTGAFLVTGIIGVLAPLILYGIVSVIRLLVKKPEDGGSEEEGGLSEFPALVTGQQPAPPFITKVLKTLLSSAAVCKPPELVKDNWRIVRDTLEGEDENEDSQRFESFLQDLHGLDDLVGSVVVDTFDVDTTAFYVALLRIDVDTEFVAWCAAGVSSVNREVWLNDLMSQGELVELAIELKTRKVDVTLASPYLDALQDYAGIVSEGLDTVLSEYPWGELLDADQQKLFPSRIYEVLDQSNGEAGSDFFELFGDVLADTELLASEPRFIDRVCRPIIEADNAAGIKWLASIAESLPTLLVGKGDQAPAANDFKNRVRLRLTNAPEADPKLPDLQKVGTALGIEQVESENLDPEADT